MSSENFQTLVVVYMVEYLQSHPPSQPCVLSSETPHDCIISGNSFEGEYLQNVHLLQGPQLQMGTPMLNDSAAYDGNGHPYKQCSTRTSVGFMTVSTLMHKKTLCMNLLPKCQVLATYLCTLIISASTA